MTEEDFLRTYRDHVGALYAFVSARTGGDRELAEDVTQEAWLRAVDGWTEQGPPREPLAWLKTVARNLLTSHFRRARPAPEGLTAEQAIDRADSPPAVALVQWALGSLRRSQRRLLEAYHFDRKPVREIAAELGKSERAVEGRLRRSRHALRRQLASALNDGSESRLLNDTED